MKILVRAHTNILEPHSVEEILAEDLFGHNPGNWLFLYSVLRTLMTEDTEFGFINGYAENLDFDNYRYINETYDAFVMPLANVFKDDWIGKLKSLTFIVEHLTIPCIVVGCGLQTEVGDTEFNFHFNSHARKFIKAVLEKSNMIGIRGETTAKYLEFLGFEREKDFTVIGCPSMFTFGLNLPELHYYPEPKKVIVNTNPDIVDSQYNAFMERTFAELSKEGYEYAYVPQRLDELRMIYLGTPLAKAVNERVSDYYPKTIDNPIYDHEVAFSSVNEWREFSGSYDFVMGSRIHGCVMGMLSGTPSLVIAKDSRVMELAQYHEIPYIMMDEINEQTDFRKLYEAIEVDSIHANHKEKFLHFIEFLEGNHLPHIYEKDIYRKDAPFDITQKQKAKVIHPVTSRDDAQVVEDMRNYITHINEFLRKSTFEFRKKILKQYIDIEDYVDVIARRESTLRKKDEIIRSKTERIEKGLDEISRQKEKIRKKNEKIERQKERLLQQKAEIKDLKKQLKQERKQSKNLMEELKKYDGLKYTIRHVFSLLKKKIIKK